MNRIKKNEKTQKGTNTEQKTAPKKVPKPTLKNTSGQPQARVETSSITEETNGNKTRQIMPDREMGTCNPQTQNR